jgi:DNA modification methylase
MSFREEIIGDCRLILGDCREVLPTLGAVDGVVTDPPYGIGEAAGKNASRTRPKSGGAVGMSGRTIVARDFGVDDWDDQPIAADLMTMVLAAGRWAIVFGGNYYALPPSSCWLVWDKLNGDSDFADCELAWTNMPKAVRRLRYLWNGICKAPGETRGDHPTQKPVGVMAWALQQLPADARTILDPFMGSGTTGVACVRAGLAFVGVEREQRYFDAACRRVEAEHRAPRLFDARPIAPVQPSLLDGAA